MGYMGREFLHTSSETISWWLLCRVLMRTGVMGEARPGSMAFSDSAVVARYS